MANAIWRQGIYSDRSLIASAGVFDLVANAPVELVAPVVSLSGGLIGNSLIGFLTTWILAFGVLYTFTPLIFTYVDALDGCENKRVFKFIFAIGAVIIGILFSPSTEFDIYQSSLLGFVTLFVASSLLQWYLSWVGEKELVASDGFGAEVLNQIVPGDVSREIEMYLQRGRASRIYASIVTITGLICMFAAFITVAGITSTVFSLAYPIPDVLVLGWAVGAVVFDRVKVGPTKSQVISTEFDFERFTIDALENATRSMSGLSGTLLILLGMSFSAMIFAVVFSDISDQIALANDQFRLLLRVINTDAPSGFENPSSSGLSYDLWPFALSINVWNVLLANITVISGIIFALFAWIRELQRFPYFLDTREDRDKKQEGEPLPRPHGFMILPCVSLILYLVWLRFSVAKPLSIQMIDIFLAVAWLPLLYLLLWAGLRSYNSNENKQPVTNELYFISGNILLISLPLSSISGATFASGTVLSVFIMLSLPKLIQLSGYEESADGIKKYISNVILFLLGSATLASGHLWPPAVGDLHLVIGSVMIIGGIWAGVSQWHKNQLST